MKAALGPHLKPFLALLILLAATALFSSVHLGPVNFPLSLLIGAAKMAVVVYFFMELKKEEALIRIAAGVGLVWLMILLMLALSDVFSRFPGRLLE